MIDLRTGLRGEFELKILKEGTREDITNGRIGKFTNLIVNGGLDLLGTASPASCTARCRLGTSNSAPANGQTGLGNAVGSSTPISSNNTQTGIETGSPLYVWQTRRYEFAAGTINGVALQEIGIFSDSNPYPMFARALIKDGGGSPTSITLAADEILQIFYTLRIYPARGDVTGTVTIDSEVFDYVLRPANIESLSPWGSSSLSFPLYPDSRIFAYETQTLGAENGIPVGSSTIINASVASYIDGTYYRDCGGTYSISQANYTNGIGSLLFSASPGGTGLARYQVSFTRQSDSFGIPKDSEKQLRLNNCFRVSWDRYVE